MNRAPTNRSCPMSEAMFNIGIWREENTYERCNIRTPNLFAHAKARIVCVHTFTLGNNVSNSHKHTHTHRESVTKYPLPCVWAEPTSYVFSELVHKYFCVCGVCKLCTYAACISCAVYASLLCRWARGIRFWPNASLARDARIGPSLYSMLSANERPCGMCGRRARYSFGRPS